MVIALANLDFNSMEEIRVFILSADDFEVPSPSLSVGD